MFDSIKLQFIDSVQMVSSGVATVLPKFVIAIAFIIIGWEFGAAVGRVVHHLVDSVKADEWLKKAGVDKFLEKAGYKLSAGAFLGWLARLFFVVIFLIVAFDVLGLSQVNVFLNDVVAYIPNVVVAALILFVASLAAEVLGGIVSGSTKAVGSHVANLLGSVTRWSIWIFAVMAALTQLQIAAQYMNILFTGIVAMLALAGGLAFGLGGKEVAGEFLRELRSEVKGQRHE
jgi:hypothetical protein